MSYRVDDELPAMRFRVLGPLEVCVGDRPLMVAGPMQRELLAVLLLRANQMVSTGALVEVVWPDRAPASARRQIQNGIGRLRRTLAQQGIRGRGGQDDVLGTVPGGYVLRADEGELDLLAFTGRVGRGRRAVGEERWGDAVGLFRDALALWRGLALAELEGDLIQGEARGLEEQKLVVLEECVEAELRLGRHHEVVGELAALVREHPLRERLWALLMLACYRAGRQAEALDAYRRAREVLVEELGVDPGPDLRRLQRAILTGDGSLDPPATPTPTGERAPTQSGQPVQASQPCQLPPDVADFTGHDLLRAGLEALLREGQAGRAVVVCAIAGMGGTGKTALAVHLAHRVRDAFPDGQLYADLRGTAAEDAEPAEVLAQFLRALCVPATALPDGLEERAAWFRERLADRRVLVVLDDAADEAQVRPLLPGVSGSAVLVTSRSRLAGLSVARLVDLGILLPAQAVGLLGRIVGERRVAAEPEAAAELARLCGWLPLALRVAGSRLAARPYWTLAHLAERLADERRRLDELAYGDLAVRGSLSLSYEDLEPRARKLFHLLGVLHSPDLASWVCAALLGVSVEEAEELIDHLVSAQLLYSSGRDARGQVRYRLHDLVHAYARERAVAEEPAEERDKAVTRALSGWLAAARQDTREVRRPSWNSRRAISPRAFPRATENAGAGRRDLTDDSAAGDWRLC